MASRDTKLNIIVDAQNRTGATFKNIEGQLGRTQTSMGSFAGTAAKLTAAFYTLQTAFSAVNKVLSTGFGVAAQLQTAEIGLTTLLGSADKARETVNRLKIESARTPFELPGLTQAAQLLTSVTKDGNKSIDIILDIGEGLAAMGKGQAELDRIIINLQQIAAVGKAATIDIKQFAFAGIPIYEMLGEVTGKTGEELAAFIEDGGVTFDLLTKMFDQANDSGGRFFNAFVNQAGSFNQTLSNLKDSFGLFAADIVQNSGLFDGTVLAMQKLSNILANYKTIIPEIKSDFVAFFAAVDEKTWLISHLKATLDTIAYTFRTVLKPSIDEFLLALQPLKPFGEALVTVFGGAFVAALHLVVFAMNLIINAVAIVLSSLTELGTYIAEAFDVHIKNLAAIIRFVSSVFKGDWGGAIEAVRSAIDTLIGYIDKLIGKFERAIALAKEVGGKAVSSLNKLLPGRADGGPVTGGSAYLVGEEGPEMFVPSTSGRIVSNGNMPSQGMLTINVTGNTLLDQDAAEKMGDLILNRLKLSNAI